MWSLQELTNLASQLHAAHVWPSIFVVVVFGLCLRFCGSFIHFFMFMESEPGEPLTLNVSLAEQAGY